MDKGVEIDKSEWDLVRIVWYEGNAYDPPGYYATLRDKKAGKNYHVMVRVTGSVHLEDSDD